MWLRIGLIAGLIVGISILHYITDPHEVEHHAVHRRLYYLPLVLACFWFGIKGAIVVSLSVIALYLPYGLAHWDEPFHGFESILEGGLYVFIALTLGILVERRKKEHEARIEAERLAGIGKAVSEIAHDMKSPLIAIGGFAEQVSRKLPQKDENHRKLQIVVQESKKLEQRIKEMLEFGRPVAMELSLTNLNDLINKTMESIRPVADDSGVELKTDPDHELPLVELDIPRFSQVLTNLVVNAVQASPRGKEVLIKTRGTKSEAIVEVSDQGSGIPENDRDKVFQPFFSTKKEGTGLGLPNVKRIVEAHGGKITFITGKDKGTTFKVSLPLKR